MFLYVPLLFSLSSVTHIIKSNYCVIPYLPAVIHGFYITKQLLISYSVLEQENTL